MPLVYRPAHAQDLARADALVVASINDLTERHGFGSMATARPPNFQLFSLKDDPAVCGWQRTAATSSVLPGVGCAVMCGFSPSCSSILPSRAVASGMNY